MKKVIILACTAFLFVTFSHAQNLDKIVKAFESNKEVEHQNITKEMLSMISSQTDSAAMLKNESFDFFKRIEKMDVFTLEDYKEKKAGSLIKAMDNYKDGNGFETLISVNEDDDRVRIVAHKEGETISEIAIMVRDESDIVLVRIVGKMTSDDLTKILDEQKGKFQKID